VESRIYGIYDLQGQTSGQKERRNSMVLNEVLASRNATSSLSLLPAANLQFSNRKLPLLESRLSHSEQMIAIGSNRKFLKAWLS
jgi:hypothetical protein